MFDASIFDWLRGLRRNVFAAAALVAGLLLASAAHAQQGDALDPPARVGRISLISGPVTLVDYQANEESDAIVNWPLTSQQRLITGRMGRVEVRIGSTSLRLDGDSVLDFNRIDDDLVQMTLQRGSAAVRVRNREHLRELDLLTPRERITLEDVGRYRIDVDRPAGITAVTANVGAARVINGRTSFAVQSGQRGEVTAEPQSVYQVVTPASDVFDDWVAARDRRDDSIQSTRYVSAETTGVESLDDHGEWRTVDSYGAVWFPTQVVSGWAPYRYGHWAFVAPWGWTWIDDASWGFTPFHYGRWVYVGSSWGWVPGAYVARPCYAPALVAWYGTPGVGVNVGWFPLAPREAFIPSYRYTPRYITRVNYGPLGGVTVVNPPPTYRYREAHFSTWAPGDAVVRRQPINRVVQQPPRDWARLPAQPAPPARVNDELRRIKPTLANVVPPAGNRPGIVPPQRAIAPTPNDTRVEPPSRLPPSREQPGRDSAREQPGQRGREPARGQPDGRDVANRAPEQNGERVNAPRVIGRPEQPRAVEPREVPREVPRHDAPRFEQPNAQPAAPAPMVRPPKVVERSPERAPAPPANFVGTPAPHVAPRPAPPVQRVEPPAQAVAPRPAPMQPMPRQEAPMHQAPPVRAAPPAQRGGEAGAPQGKPMRVEPQRN